MPIAIKFMYKWNNKKQVYRNSVEEQSPENPQPQLQPLLINMNGEQSITTASIRVVENKIFFYGEIDEQSMLELNRILVEVDLKLQNTKNILGDDYIPRIHLHISTTGGGVMAAFSCVDTIRNLKSEVYTYVDGMVASAGTLLSSVGTKRFIGMHGHMLIHQISSIVAGTYANMEDAFENTTNLMSMLKQFYKKYTKVPMKKLDEILKRDLYLTAEDCVKMGLVDQII